MDPWDHIRRAVGDTRSGSLAVTTRAAAGVTALRTKRDIARARRALLRAHPTMAVLRRMLDDALAGEDPLATVERAREQTAAAADGVRWVVSGRANIVLTHSGSDAVHLALRRIRSRVRGVRCAASLPGGEGRAFARRLERDGFDVIAIADTAVARTCDEATLALVGADAITRDAVVNKVGTHGLALAARDAQIGCYVIGCTSKLLAVDVEPPERFEATPLHLFDAILTEKGALRPGQIRRAVSRL